MNNIKIGFSLRNDYPLPINQVVKMLKSIGFDAISPAWKDAKALDETIKSIRQAGLQIQFLHAPFLRAANMWSFDEKLSEEAKEELFKCLDACKNYQIPILVMHAWIGLNYSFDPKNLNFKNYDAIVKKAEEYGVKIAFENTEGEEYLFALMDRYKDNPTVGFCWDSGHEMCYNGSKDILSKFSDKLLVTHLNDNLGMKYEAGNDLHFLPFDGIADWEYNLNRLKQSQRLDILNFEVSRVVVEGRPETDLYGALSTEEYFKKAYEKAIQIAKMY